MIRNFISKLYSLYTPSIFMSGGGSPSGYVIERSLRFNAASSQYLTRTFGTPTNNTIWTWSKWIKRGSLGSIQCLFSAGSAGVFFNASDQLIFTSNAGATLATSTRVFRDPSAHWHLKVSSDGTTVTAHWNNELCLSYTGTITNINSAIAHNIGRNAGGSNQHLDSYESEDVFVDGQSLAASSFGQTDSTTGQWVAKKYTGTYGNNGSYLDFKDGTSTTTLGHDKSGNNNHWTLTNFTRSAGVNDCWMLDVPSGNGDVSGTQPSSNYATLNPLVPEGIASNQLSNGNLNVAGTVTGGVFNKSTFALPSSGKFYFEACSLTANSSMIAGWFGVCGIDGTSFSGLLSRYGLSPTGMGFKQNDVSLENTYRGGLNVVVGVAIDRDANTVSIYLDGVLQTAFTPTMATGKDLFAFYGTYTSGTGWANFGQRSFAYTPPAGFKALCTANLTSTDVIESGSFTGNANANGVFVWCNGTPETLTINGNAVTWGTHADKLANGFKLRTSSSSYNSSGTNTWTATILSPESKSAFKHQNAKGN